MTPTWDILLLTLPSRGHFLNRMIAGLEPQVQGHGQVHVVIETHDNPEKTLGEMRQAMREASRATYICFVDDDDLVAEDYVDRILPLLTEDYVGFRLQAYEDGVALPGPTYHSLLCGGWFDRTFADGTRAWYRDISHLNPIRRELALAVPMYGGFAEDSRWAGELRRLAVVKRERFVDAPWPMYHYLSRTDKTDGVRPGPTQGSAGVCAACKSLMTVIVSGQRFCNACGSSGARDIIETL